jgi:translation initiation factor 2 subunit 2
MDYEAMLKRGKDQLPEELSQSARFTIPKVRGHIQGVKTVVNNWMEIAKALDRPPQHLLKYVQKALATPGEIIKQSVLFGSKISAAKINEKIEQYADELVFCKECGKPETQIEKDGGTIQLTCQACGAKYPARTRI